MLLAILLFKFTTNRSWFSPGRWRGGGGGGVGGTQQSFVVLYGDALPQVQTFTLFFFLYAPFPQKR